MTVGGSGRALYEALIHSNVSLELSHRVHLAGGLSDNGCVGAGAFTEDAGRTFGLYGT